jgi:hypothetical protein
MGRGWGGCLFCGRPLWDKRSCDTGYGPDCARRYGLPWGDLTHVVADDTSAIEDDDLPW